MISAPTTMLSSSPDPGEESAWADVPETFRSADGSLPEPWDLRFGPLRRGAVDDLVVVGQFGQSVDARVATSSGHSHYINGEAGLAHLHRLRALVDAVVVGVGTAIADDPLLTVRRVRGPSPARVVIDPKGRLPAAAKLLAPDGCRRIVMTTPNAKQDLPPGVEVLVLDTVQGEIAPAAMLAALARCGMRRILVEGGANTVSRFLVARCLDRLHVTIAPIIFGSGRHSIDLPPIKRVEEAIQAPMRIHSLGSEALLDCDLSAQRVVVGTAKMSM